jgi:hypothetical protein
LSRRPLRGLTRLLSGLTAALTLGALITPAASADPPLQLVLTASVGNETHLVGKPFELTLSLHNVSPEPLTAVRVEDIQRSGSGVSITDWKGLAYSQPGVTIAPGATSTFTLPAVVSSLWAGTPVLAFRAFLPDEDQQTAELTVPIVDPATTTGSAGGVLYGDLNGNGSFDAGEALAGATVNIFGGDNDFTTKTGADGSFVFSSVPVRRYGLGVQSLPDRWVFDNQNATLDVGLPDSTAVLRAVRPLSDQLHATASLDRTSYAPGDPVQVTVALTNTGSTPLSGITGECDRAGDSQQEIAGWKSWSDLMYPASLTFAPGETRTFTETGTVPAVANQYGGFGMDCDFGTVYGNPDGYPFVDLWARVPGTPADTDGRIYHDDNHNSTQDPGEAIADTAVSLVDAADGQVTVTGQTDSDGHFAFTAVPAGRYELRVAGGWIPADRWSSWVQVGTCLFCGGGGSQIFTHA